MFLTNCNENIRFVAAKQAPQLQRYDWCSATHEGISENEKHGLFA